MAAADTFPAWIYDGSAIDDPLGHGERGVRFLRALNHPKAPGGRFTLDSWQERIVRRIYGPRHANGTRIVKTVVLLLPRGNRKTSLSAALALLHSLGPERVPGGEVISAASDRKQARLGFGEATGIIRATPALAKVTSIQDYRNRLVSRKHGSFYESISSDAGTQHGRTPVFVLADEVHAWKKRDLWDVLRSGLVKTPGSLLVVATTAGRGQENVAFDGVDYARKVACGEIDDPATLPILFEADADEDWRDEKVWHRVNPGLSCSPPYPDIEGLRQLAREAENRPGDRDAFRQLNLNTWLDHSAAPFVEMAIYNKCAEKVNLKDLEGKECWLGVDLSSNQDLTAIVAAWCDGDGYIVHPWFFCPKDNLRGRASKDGVPYPAWADNGFIITTPGNSIDYRYIEKFIRDLKKRFDIREIAYDPWNSNSVISNLEDDGFPVAAHRQGFQSMNPSIRELERALISGKLKHGGHPILRWNFSNIAVKLDPAGNIKFDKGKSRDRIDGVVACAMAIGRAAFATKKKYSMYSDPNFKPEDIWID